MSGDLGLSSQRWLSLVLAFLYLGFAFYDGGLEAFLEISLFLVLPLSCIWFGELLGSIFAHPAINHSTPGCIISGAGWFLLLLPAAFGIISWIKNPS